MDQLTNKEFATDFRSGVMQIEKEMLEHEQVEMPVTHHFSKDLYARELFIPAGTLLVGKIHKHERQYYL